MVRMFFRKRNVSQKEEKRRTPATIAFSPDDMKKNEPAGAATGIPPEDAEHGTLRKEEGTDHTDVQEQVKNGSNEAGEGVPSAIENVARTQRQTGECETAMTAGETAIYDDTDVCRILGLRKRILVQARKASRRGVDWDVAGMHAGMTHRWIKGWNAKADIESLTPIKTGDGIVTVKVVGHVTNAGVIIAERVADGTRVMVRVHDARYLHRNDEMDCRMEGGMLSYAQELNRERY